MKKMKKTLFLTAVIMAFNVFPVSIFADEEGAGFENSLSQEENEEPREENEETAEKENSGIEEGPGGEILPEDGFFGNGTGINIQEMPTFAPVSGETVIKMAVNESSFANELENHLTMAVNSNADTVIELVCTADEVSFKQAVEINFPAGYSSKITIRLNSDSPSQLTIKSPDAQRHFVVTGDSTASPTLKFENIILDGGDAGGGISIDSDMAFTLEGAEIQHCYSTGNGGGLYTKGSLEIKNSVFRNNKAESRGGGLYIEGSSLTVSNCNFTENKAEDNGGGLAAYDETQAAVFHSIFDGNSAGEDGGGIHIRGYNLHHEIAHCEVKNNRAGRNAGGLFVQSDMTISDSFFTENRAGNKGGAIVEHDDYSTLTVTGSEIWNNTAGTNGGGINPRGNLNLKNSKIFNNTAGEDGGGICVDAYSYFVNTILINNGQICGNRAERDGGGIFISFAWNPSTVTIKGSKIKDNSAKENGGGLYISNFQPLTIEDNEITYNTASHGGGLYIIDPDELTINSSVFGFNLADEGYDSTVSGAASFYSQWDAIEASAPFDHILNNYDIFHISPDFYLGLTYTAVFRLNDGTSKEAGRVALNTNQPSALGDKFPGNPVRAGYDFKSWNTEDDGSGDVVTRNTVLDGDKNVILYGQWQRESGVVTPPPTDNGSNGDNNVRDRDGKNSEYVIGLNFGDGSPVKNITVKANGKLAQPENPIREGYRFTGWYTDQSFKTLYDFHTKAEKNFILYAGWEAIEEENTEIEKSPSLSAYISGYPDGTFRPDASISWGESMVMIDRAVHGQKGSEGNLWYEEALNTLPQVISDYLGENFEGDKKITREEFIVMALAYMDVQILEGTADFTDIDMDSWGRNYIYTAAVKGILAGYPDGTFMPHKAVSRAEAVVIINKITGRSKNTLSTSGTAGFSDLSPEHWAYEAIAIALGEHEPNN